MVAGLAFLATAIATVFAQATARRARLPGARPHEWAWTIALVMFALASAALATGASTGWDAPTFRAFYLFGAILNVPWLALGTVFLLAGPRAGRAVRAGLLVFSGFAAGVVLSAPLTAGIPPTGIPQGRDHFEALPRILAAAGSGIGAIVLLGGAAWSAVHYVRARSRPGAGRLALGNILIALGVLIASTGGLLQGLLGEDEAFAATTALTIAVIYAGFAVASSRSSRRRSLPAAVRGRSSTTTTRVGSL